METKKNPKIALAKKRGLLLNIGFVISLLLVIVAFEWKSYDEVGLLEIGQVNDDFEEMLDIPLTRQPPPPPPAIRQPEIIEVPDEEIIEVEVDVDLDVEITEETLIEELILKQPVEEEIADEVFTIVEQYPAFVGGDIAFKRFIQINLKYPAQAIKMGIEGRVFVQFVVEKNGSLTEVSVLKGIGGGCDEAAVKIIQKSAVWKPGKQRGRPVRVRMVVPLTFKI
jgi:periplasmic protein TonB